MASYTPSRNVLDQLRPIDVDSILSSGRRSGQSIRSALADRSAGAGGLSSRPFPATRRHHGTLRRHVAVPRTATFGAILITAFAGGAICTHLRVGEIGSPPQLVACALAAVARLSLFLRDANVRRALGFHESRLGPLGAVGRAVSSKSLLDLNFGYARFHYFLSKTASAKQPTGCRALQQEAIHAERQGLLTC